MPPNMSGPDLNSKAVNEYLNGTPSLSRQYSESSSLDLKGQRDFDCAGCNMNSKKSLDDSKDIAAAGCYAIILWIKSTH
ncbi:hypothetical protein Tco_1573160 [Tanacetum coccineum]